MIILFILGCLVALVVIIIMGRADVFRSVGQSAGACLRVVSTEILAWRRKSAVTTL